MTNENESQYVRQLEQQILEQKAQLEELAEREERFREIAENVREVFFMISAQTDEILYISPTYEKIWGRSCESLYHDPQSWLLAIHPEDSFEAMATLETQFRTGEEFEEEYRIIRPDGTIKWVWVRAFPICDDRGKVNRFVGIAEDVSERQEAIDALRKSEKQFRLTFEKAPIGMAITTLDDQFQRVNLALCDLLGYTQEELIKLNLTDINHPEDFPIYQAEKYKLLSEEESDFQMENRYVSIYGRVVDTILKVVLIRDEKGTPLHFHNQIVDISDRKRIEKQLFHDAFHDGLTGLPNRALFMDRLGQALKRNLQGENQLFAVLFLDLDRFKVVNESVGHLLGDKLLISLARRLEDCVHPADTVARLGGDEFSILLENLKEQQQAIKVAEIISQKLKKPFNLDGYELFTTVSIGIAFCNQDYQQPEDLLRDADLSMYHAKDQGKARYAIFDTSMHKLAIRRLQLESELRLGIKNQEFQLYYQPITSLVTGKLSGFEALVRWLHPENGLISPAEFIPIAEETGLIIPIGNWVLREACHQLSVWHEKFPAHPPLKISINLSGKEITEPDLLEKIDQILAETGISGRQIKLEITESILIDNLEVATNILSELRKRDIQLSIDDFGTGYSSLSYLHRFPVNTLKIDQSFVKQMQAKDYNSEIVRAIITLAHILNMDVIAEGIETTSQLAELKLLKCEQGQGYLFSKPLSKVEAEILIRKSPQW